MTEFSRAHRAFGRRDREGDSDSAMNPSMGARTVHSGALGIIVAVATLLLGCGISKTRSGLGRSPHAVASGGGPIQFNLDKTHFNILGE